MSFLFDFGTVPFRQCGVFVLFIILLDMTLITKD